MAARFVDYYEVLAVKRDASQEDIQRAYRAAARQFHPDVNKDPAAQKKFQDAQEAYEVLKDAERRKRYDQLGADYKPGQEFRPPAGWSGQGRGSRGSSGGGRAGEYRVNFGGDGGPESTFSGSNFSEFFESLFGGGAGGGFDPFSEASQGAGRGRGGAGRQHANSRGPRRGTDAESEITISLEDAASRAMKRLSLSDGGAGAGGAVRTLEVKIPAGVTDGTTMRLAGQGGPGSNGGPAGDLLLRIRISPDARFRIDAADPFTLIGTLAVTPWEAALGAKVPLRTIDSEVTVTVPPGTSSGQRMRIRGHGLPNKSGERADLIAEIRIVVPRSLDDETRALYEQLAAKSNFDPRGT